ncbi:hypothetical protein AB0M83_15840 [Amycolatopsis sp. NPDC051106]|uniref:hypothetical protein n=1 Tax=unclassified Amycolatopsis TaxID=2618356 RepID=UPI0034381145
MEHSDNKRGKKILRLATAIILSLALFGTPILTSSASLGGGNTGNQLIQIA